MWFYARSDCQSVCFAVGPISATIDNPAVPLLPKDSAGRQPETHVTPAVVRCHRNVKRDAGRRPIDDRWRRRRLRLRLRCGHARHTCGIAVINDANLSVVPKHANRTRVLRPSFHRRHRPRDGRALRTTRIPIRRRPARSCARRKRSAG